MKLPWEIEDEEEKPKKKKEHDEMKMTRRERRKKKKLSESNYFFPSIMAKMMQKIDMRTQYEASMLSMTFILFGLFISVFYMVFFVAGLPNWYKVTLILNLIAGFVFLSSFLVTTFQQYKSYLKAKEFQEELKGG